MKDKYSNFNLVRYLLASLFPVILVAFWLYGYYGKLSDEMKVSVRETEGIFEIDGYYQMMKIAQQIRDLRMIQGGDANLISLVETLQKTLQDNLESHIREEQDAWMSNRDELVQLGRELKFLNRTSLNELPREVMFSRYTRLAETLIQQIRFAAENSHLAQDFRLQSYYLADLVIRRLPVITESLARIRGRSVYRPIDQKEAANRRFTLQHHIEQLREELGRFRVASAKMAPIVMENGHGTASLAQVLDQRLNQYMLRIEALLESGQQVPALQLFDEGSQAINLVGRVYKTLIRDLNTVLRNRLKSQSRERIWLTVGGVSGLLLIVFSIFWFYRNNLRAQLELSGANRLLSTVQDSMIDALILMDDYGTIVRFNKAAEKIFGYRASEVLGQNVRILMPEPYHSQHDEYLRRYHREGSPRVIGNGIEVMAKRKDGSVFPAELGVSELWVDNRRIYNGVMRDLSERRKVEESLRQFKSTLDRTLDCVFIFDAQTLRFTYVNQGAMNQVGYTQDELMQMHPFDIKPEFDEVRFREFIRPMVNGEKNGLLFETTHQHKDGAIIPVEIYLQYIAPEGERGRFVAIVHDITERKKIERLKNEFVSNVSHELRTPLTSIRGALGLVTGLGMSDMPEQTQSLLKIASNNTERLLLLINDILDIQKIESGHMRFRFRTLNLKSLIEKSIKDNESYGEQYDVHFVAQDLQEDVTISADPDRMMQVLSNLLSNAAKFSPPGSRVEIGMQGLNGVARITVRDYGAGIPEEFHAKIFEKFTQFDAADNHKMEGTGLGLSISKAIMEKHGGSIRFDTGPGGTTFIVEVPKIQSATDIEKIAASEQGNAHHAGRILVVEDDHDLAGLIARMLNDAGFQCDIAHTAREARALALAGGVHYSAITLDVLLPDEDGVSLIQYFCGEPALRDVPIIVVSCVADETQHHLNGTAIGVVDWLNKPIDQERLVNAVRLATHGGKQPRILHVEDDADVRQIVEALLYDKAEVHGCGLLRQARDCLEKDRYDMVLLDIQLPDGSGLELLRDIQQSARDTRVVIFSAHEVSPDISREVSAVLAKYAVSNRQLMDTIISIIGQD